MDTLTTGAFVSPQDHKHPATSVAMPVSPSSTASLPAAPAPEEPSQEAVPSSQRVEPGSATTLPAAWPASAKNPASVDAVAVAQSVVSSFNNALATKHYFALAGLFMPENSFWRDHLALSWDLHTLHGPAKIAGFLSEARQGCLLTRIDLVPSTDFLQPELTDFSPLGGVTGIQAFLTITTTRGTGRGLVRLAEGGDGEWKIWTMYTVLQSIKGHEETVRAKRPQGVQHGEMPGRKNWLDRRKEETEFTNAEPDVLIIGAGQAGLTAHARLRMLNVRTLIVDRASAVGDNWRNRYHQLVLHDPVWYDHLPYIPFPDSWPVYTPKNKLADWFAAYASALELNVWMRSEIESATWDESTRQWTVAIKRCAADGSVHETRVLHPRHIVQCTGASGKKNMPAIPGMDSFQGDLLCHSSEFPGARGQDSRSGRKKKAVVVGACNSSHDICQDYYEKGWDVTMVQRSTTCVVTSESVLAINIGWLYSEDGPPPDDADVWQWSWPAAAFKRQQIDVTTKQQAADKPLLDALTAAGFAVDRGPHGCGLMTKYLQRGGGYYLDVGASQLIVDGKISVASGRDVAAVTARGLRLADGTELEADEIVFATGYANMRTQARLMLGDAVADRVSDVWGWDDEGEMRALWRRSGHPGFWFHGGNLAICRYFSRVLALQIKAQLEGLDKDE